MKLIKRNKNKMTDIYMISQYLVAEIILRAEELDLLIPLWRLKLVKMEQIKRNKFLKI